MEFHTRNAIKQFVTVANTAQPLIVCDADEVLLQFFTTLEGYLERNGYYVKLDSFALNKNIRDAASHEPASADQISDLMQTFFKTDIHTSPAVDGAVDALARLSNHAEICIVTNFPGTQASARQLALEAIGLSYPVICNTGGKGPALAHIAEHWTAQIAFIDDLPPNHDSVASDAPDVHRIHFVADPRLSKLIEKPQSAHKRAHSWAELEQHLFDWLPNR